MLHKGEVAAFETGFSNPPVNLVGADTVTQLLEVTDERQATVCWSRHQERARP